MYAIENRLNNEGICYDSKKFENSTITRVSGDTYTGAWTVN